MANSIFSKGRVILAGAGPGDPELLTIKTVRYLQKADVIITDRLVGKDIITQYAQVNAEVIFAGKQCSSHFSTPQEMINELMVQHALQNKLVIRLKGGDVSFFSNVLDELNALRSFGIDYEIIPGITAAQGASAYAAIPLTARNHADGVRFITHYKNDEKNVRYWDDLAETSDTLVLYMSSGMVQSLAENLTRQGISPNKKIAIIEQATTPKQHVYVSNLYTLKNKPWYNKKFLSPSLVIIGAVVNLHEKYKWNENDYSNQHHFNPITSPLFSLTDSD